MNHIIHIEPRILQPNLTAVVGKMRQYRASTDSFTKGELNVYPTSATRRACCLHISNYPEETVAGDQT